MIITKGQESNKTVIRKTIGGVTTEIDLTQVEEITNTLEKLLKERENSLDRRHVPYSIEILEKTGNMNSKQLRYLVTNLVGLVCKYADLYQRVLDNPEEECARIREYKDFFDLIEKHT